MSTVPEETAGSRRPTWAAIDCGAFERNVSAINQRLPPGSKLIAVLKANAYGHGAVTLARRCRAGEVAMIATSLLEESLELRGSGVELPLLVLGPLGPGQIAEAVDHRITIGIVGPEELRSVCEIARGRDVDIHLKLDTGMGRMGVIPSELSEVVSLIKTTERLHLCGIYTHFANASDPTDPFTDQQIATFRHLTSQLREGGLDAPIHHTSNSAATMRGLTQPGDLVRVGISLYGAEALDRGESRLEPVMRWRTEIARLKTLSAGHAVGYGTTFHTRRESRIATLPVGYADGYNRLLSNRGEVLVHGQRAPVVGRVSMDLLTIDVTDIPGAALGEEVVLLGSQGSQSIPAEELASKIGTIPYEIFCNVSARVPRVAVSGTI